MRRRELTEAEKDRFRKEDEARPRLDLPLPPPIYAPKKVLEEPQRGVVQIQIWGN